MHLLSTSQFAFKCDLDRLFQITDLMQNPHVKGIDLIYQARGKVMAIVKDEGSTRTRMSFEVAMKRLGGEVTVLELDKNSSVVKGESLEDTIRTVSEYVDVIVLRLSEKGAVARTSNYSRVPVINAGDGDGEHPTQALLDIYTIQKEFGGVDGINIMLVGDLKYSRTVHSLLNLLVLYKDVRVQLVSPPDLMLPSEYCSILVDPVIAHDLDKRLSLDPPDVIYMTRQQKERGSGGDYPVLKELPKKALVMHPLPRCGELPVKLGEEKGNAIWKQVRNGMFVRMALLYDLFNHNTFYPWE